MSLTNFINTDRDTQLALAELKYLALGTDVDESTLSAPVRELRSHLKGCVNFSVSLAPEFRGGVDEIAEIQNSVYRFLSDPVQNLVSRIKGHMSLKSDSKMCIENKRNWETGELIELTQKERWEVRRLKEDIDLYQAAIDMIEKLNDTN